LSGIYDNLIKRQKILARVNENRCAWLRERLFLHAKYLRAAGDRRGQQTVVNRLRPHRSPRALAARRGVNDIDAIYFTHVHPDHCTGLTALLNYWKSSPVRSR
jgi:glyoxylase-like metal-dependent hydrolase (beta-lactamase superfamily II)